MRIKNLKFAMIFVILVTLFLFEVTEALKLSLTIETDKDLYSVGDHVSIVGKLMINGSPVTEALIGLEIDDAKGQLFTLRAIKSGPNATGPWPLEILEVTTCDSSGNPKSNFRKGEDLGFKISVKNNMATSCDLMIIITLLYANAEPFYAFVAYQGSLDPKQSTSFMIWPISIPDDAIAGEAVAYVSALDKLLKDGGSPYCPEVKVAFNITDGSATKKINSEPQYGEETFNLTVTIPHTTVVVGNYTIYARAHWSLYITSNMSTFEVKLKGDFNNDGKINMKDIAVVAKAFGSAPGDPNWTPEADLNNDGKIDMKDISIIAKTFGAEAIDP